MNFADFIGGNKKKNIQANTQGLSAITGAAKGGAKGIDGISGLEPGNQDNAIRRAIVSKGQKGVEAIGKLAKDQSYKFPLLIATIGESGGFGRGVGNILTGLAKNAVQAREAKEFARISKEIEETDLATAISDETPRLQAMTLDLLSRRENVLSQSVNRQLGEQELGRGKLRTKQMKANLSVTRQQAKAMANTNSIFEKEVAKGQARANRDLTQEQARGLRIQNDIADKISSGEYMESQIIQTESGIMVLYKDKDGMYSKQQNFNINLPNDVKSVIVRGGSDPETKEPGVYAIAIGKDGNARKAQKIEGILPEEDLPAVEPLSSVRYNMALRKHAPLIVEMAEANMKAKGVGKEDPFYQQLLDIKASLSGKGTVPDADISAATTALYGSGWLTKEQQEEIFTSMKNDMAAAERGELYVPYGQVTEPPPGSGNPLLDTARQTLEEAGGSQPLDTGTGPGPTYEVKPTPGRTPSPVSVAPGAERSEEETAKLPPDMIEEGNYVDVSGNLRDRYGNIIGRRR